MLISGCRYQLFCAGVAALSAPSSMGRSSLVQRLQLAGTMVVARRSTVLGKKACCSQQNGLRLPANWPAASSKIARRFQQVVRVHAASGESPLQLLC